MSEARRGKKYLGDLLVESGIITNRQLEEALQQLRQKKGNGKMLGQILVEMRYCSEEDVARMLAVQAGVPYVSLETCQADESVFHLLSPEMARRYRAVPVGFDEGKLLVAMMHPRDLVAIDDLRILTGFDIQPVVCSDSELQAAMERLARAGIDIETSGMEEENQIQVMPAPEDEAAGMPAVRLANLIFRQAVQSAASDVHIEPQEKALRVRFRIDGVLHEIQRIPLRLHPLLVSRIKVMAGMDIAERRVPQDGRITLTIEGKVIDVRVASLPTAWGEKLTLRLLDRSSRLISLENLGFPAAELDKYNGLMRLPYGFLLVTGPTGSGKSTTLYATLAVLNSPEKHIITVEDPIEYRLEGVNQIQVNNRAGLTFASGLRSILRNDPDIIMIGEIRDQETARIAVESALTGHMVFSTLHTNDAAGAISRLCDMGIEPYLITSSLVGVLAQRLTRVLCSHCREPVDIRREVLLRSVPDFPLEEEEDVVRIYRPKGCVRCSNTGYRGRVGVFELLLVNETIQKLTLQRASSREIKDAAVADGMVTLRRDGLLKVKQGLTSLEEVMRVIV